MEYYPAIMRNELSSQEKPQMNLKCILLSETNQSEKATYYMTLIMLYSGKGKPTELVKRSVVCCDGLNR